MTTVPVFPTAEYDERLARVRAAMGARELDGVLVTIPENIYYLCGFDHMGYFAYQALVVPRDGTPVIVTRAMERATVRDQVPGLEHIGYSDGSSPAPLPPPASEADVILATTAEDGRAAGLRPWEMSFGQGTATGPASGSLTSRAQVDATVDALRAAGLGRARVGIEKNSSFLPLAIAEALVAGSPAVEWIDSTGLVEDCRMVQSPREVERTRAAARISDAMMLSASAAAGVGVPTHDVMAAIYDAMFRRGGTYPGFVPLVRSTHTLQHEHGTWQDGRLRNRDLLFLEMAGCVRRYHAPIGRLVFIGSRPRRTERIQEVCLEAMLRAAEVMRPGALARDVYAAWQARVTKAGFANYSRHHCGYSVGIGYPPSWSGGGVPVGLRPDSSIELCAGMVFHLMSWLLRTGRGDCFLSDTVLVTDSGCEFLTHVERGVCVR